MEDPGRWLLSAGERGNPAAAIPPWTAGNLAAPLVHGAAYFDRLVEEVEALGRGDHLFFTDWRGDPDERPREDGPTVAELFTRATRRGVCVRGLVWRSHWDRLSFSKEENRALDAEIEHGGGEVILDQRVRRGGSHHQKFVVLRHVGDPARDVAFAGGIDLCHARRDDDRHLGDPQPQPMSAAHGPRPPWHDVQLMLRGPAVGVLDTAFRERWDDPTNADVDHPIARVRDTLHRGRLSGDPLPPQLPPPPEAGPHVVQTLRTYPAVRPPYDFAPEGERSVARGYSKAIRRARRLVYLEDQYMWSIEVARLFAESLAGARAVPAGGPRPGARLRRGEPRGGAGVRARQGVRRRRRLGQRGQRQLQPAVLDPRQRALLGRPRRRPGPARAPGPGRHRRRGAGLRPRPAPAAGPRAPRSGARRPRGRRPARRGGLRGRPLRLRLKREF